MALARARRVGEIFVRTLTSRAWWAPPRRPSPAGAGLSHMEFSMSRPCERRVPYGADSHFCTGAEAFFRFLGPGVMGPCVPGCARSRTVCDGTLGRVGRQAKIR